MLQVYIVFGTVHQKPQINNKIKFMKLIGVSGKLGSGKDTLAKLIAKNIYHQYPTIYQKDLQIN